jgi:hypothetical protein
MNIIFPSTTYPRSNGLVTTPFILKGGKDYLEFYNNNK